MTPEVQSNIHQYLAKHVPKARLARIVAVPFSCWFRPQRRCFPAVNSAPHFQIIPDIKIVRPSQTISPTVNDKGQVRFNSSAATAAGLRRLLGESMMIKIPNIRGSGYRAAAWQAAAQHVSDRCCGHTRRRRLVHGTHAKSITRAAHPDTVERCARSAHWSCRNAA
jgi:hypothetical protein